MPALRTIPAGTATIAAIQSGEDVARSVATRITSFQTDDEAIAFAMGFIRHGMILRSAAKIIATERYLEQSDPAFLERRDDMVREGLVALSDKLADIAASPVWQAA
jgi:hypothetical protein